jgi:SNF2 family DNA or RNA helicase
MADEMGLGKTIQMLGVMLCNFRRRTLIILPKALIAQWVSTIESVLGHSPLLYHGASVKNITEEDLKRVPIVISTYGMLRKNSPLLNVRWDRTIFDEAHHIRNNKTQKHLSATKLNSAIMWFVTGTPIQNHESDLYSIFALMKIPKDTYMFSASKPNYGVVKQLKKVLMLKRTEVSANLKLPKTTNHDITVTWKNEDERSVAEEVHAHIAAFNINMDRGNRFQSPWQQKVLPFMCFTKQVCTAPKSLGKHIKKLTGQETVTGDAIRDPTPEDNVILQAIEHSSKLDCAVKVLQSRKNNGRKKLVFAQFRTEMSIIEQQLRQSGVSVDVISGATSSNLRRAILDNLATAERDYVLLLQIQVGCEGLNLQQFSEVYFLSPNWNPAIEDQAVARCHRIGQTQPVDIFRFSMEGFGRESINIENYITDTQTKKRKKMITSDDCWNGSPKKQRTPTV